MPHSLCAQAARMPAAVTSPQNLEHVSRKELELSCQKLQQDAAAARVQRDALTKEIELLTSSATSFDFTSILRERVWAAETALKRTQRELAEVQAAHKDMQEDCAQLRQAKRTSDSATREVRMSY